MVKIPGYNSPRPTREQYEDFERKLTEGIKGLDIEGISLMLYGSYVRGDWDAGRSDVDGVLILPDDVVINKENLARASSVVADALRDNPIDFEVTVTDLRTMVDGRFNTFTPDFREYFANEARIVGEDYLQRFRYQFPNLGGQEQLRFNLRKSRSALLFADHYIEKDDESFVLGLDKVLKSASRGSKQVLYLQDEVFRVNRFSALEDIPRYFPEVDVSPLAEMKELFKDHDRYDALRKDSQGATELATRSLTFFESMIKAYLDRHPRE